MKVVVPCAIGLVALFVSSVAQATQVQVVGVIPGRSATVRIDGGAPMVLRVGETIEAVTLLDTDREGATLRVDGATQVVSLAGTSGSSARGGGTIQLSADAQGHFITTGAVNGRPVKFLVDTGATAVMLTRAEAERLGLRYRNGAQVMMQTASGVARGWRVELNSVTVDNVTVRQVDAVVAESDAVPFALLGMTFLNHFDLQRRGSTLTLQRRR